MMIVRLKLFFLMCVLVVAGACDDREQKTGKAPILLLATNLNHGLYIREILLTEGFNAFEIDSLDKFSFDASRLEGHDVVVLAQSDVTSEQAKALSDYVNDGGNLIAFRPDKTLLPLFGISAKGQSVNEGYISINTDSDLTLGLIKESLQIHGEADQYQPTTAQAIAFLLNDTSANSGSPAVVMNKMGKGRAFAFSYNLPESIVLTRQGNYRDAGKEMDGITGIRAMDLFTGGWVNNTKNTVNQADEQMRLFSRCLEFSAANQKPIPRFWYFPDSLHCLVTLNNDGEDSKEAEFTPQFEDVEAKGAKMTLYIKETKYISKEWVKKWAGKGFEMAGHPDDTKQATAPDWNTMDRVIKELKAKIKKEYGIAELMTNTNHWFVWVGKHPNDSADFTGLAKIEEQNGMLLDCNYAHYDNGSKYGHFLGKTGVDQGNYTGSGLPMKFSDMSGKTINVYQQLNNVYDQQYMENKDQDGYYHAFRGLMDRSLEKGVYSYISVRAHNNEYYFSKIPLMNMLDYANSKKVPVWTEVNLLKFLQTKDEARFTDISWKEGLLSFNLKSRLTHESGISFLLPARFGGKKISTVSDGGRQLHFRMENIKGVDYAMITVAPGSDHSFEVRYLN